MKKILRLSLSSAHLLRATVVERFSSEIQRQGDGDTEDAVRLYFFDADLQDYLLLDESTWSGFSKISKKRVAIRCRAN